MLVIFDRRVGVSLPPRHAIQRSPTRSPGEKQKRETKKERPMNTTTLKGAILLSLAALSVTGCSHPADAPSPASMQTPAPATPTAAPVVMAPSSSTPTATSYNPTPGASSAPGYTPAPSAPPPVAYGGSGSPTGAAPSAPAYQNSSAMTTPPPPVSTQPRAMKNDKPVTRPTQVQASATSPNL